MVLNVILIKYFAITGAAIALLLSYILLTLTKAKNIKLYETDLKKHAEKISGT
jgi:O-antigen/teichoic acid export membrane protein